MAGFSDSSRKCFAITAIFLASLANCSAGGETDPYEDALLVPAEPGDRPRLAGLLAQFADERGLYFRDSSHYMARTTNGSIAVYMVLFRQLSDGSEWHEITAIASHNEFPVVTFQEAPDGEFAESAPALRTALKVQLGDQWRDAARVPILPRGGIPNVQDLVRTSTGLKISPASAGAYELPPASPLLAP